MQTVKVNVVEMTTSVEKSLNVIWNIYDWYKTDNLLPWSVSVT